jgi:CRP-like cAMP-binding protein
MVRNSPFENAILARLTREDLDLLTPHLEPVELVARQKVAEPRRGMDYVYFVEGGILSYVGSIRGDIPVEIGIAGREGIGNLWALMGSDRSAHECMCQVPGRAQRMPAERAVEAMAASAALNHLVRQAAYLFIAQTSSTVIANARASVSQRLARWLLMARDRLDDDEMPLTHEFISYMVGSRRPAVTLALQSFEEAEWITRVRGRVTLIDRDALIAEAGGFYGAAEQEAARIHGEAP